MDDADRRDGTGDEGARRSPEATGIDAGVPLVDAAVLEELRARAAGCDEAEARALRLQADLDNFRRREQRERRQAADEEVGRVLAPVFHALDSFTRAVDAAARARDLDALVDGVRLTLREVERGLAESGIERVEAVGCSLDPSVHHAVAQTPTADAAPMTIIEEFAAGWRRGDRLLRPAIVRVAVAAPQAPADNGTADGTPGE